MLALGYNVWRYKLAAFVLAATFAGLAGCLYVYYNRFVSPDYLAGGPLGRSSADGHPRRRRHADRTGDRRRAHRAPAKTSSAPIPSAGCSCSASSTSLVALFAPTGYRWFRSRISREAERSHERARPSATFPEISAACRRCPMFHSRSQPGERRLIIGPNGAGKTTLFNMLSGAFAVSGGRVMLFGRDITRLPPYERARIGLSPHLPDHQSFPAPDGSGKRSAGAAGSESSAFSLHRRACAITAPACFAPTRCCRMGSDSDWQRRPRKEISYGEQRQIDLILAMAMQPKVLAAGRADSRAVRRRSRPRRRHGCAACRRT